MNKTQSIQTRAQELINRAQRFQSEELDLSGYNLGGTIYEIPKEVFELYQLETLNLSDNHIYEVPKKIRDLPNLKHLKIARNPLTEVPDVSGLEMDLAAYMKCYNSLSFNSIEGIWIGNYDQQLDELIERYGLQIFQELACLPCLRFLTIDLPINYFERPKIEGQISEIINNLCQFQLLECLHICGVSLGNVPTGIRYLRKLSSLGMVEARLRIIPDWFGEIELLHNLNLEFNDLTDLPVSLANLTKLEKINLSFNRFTKIPDVIFRIKNLTHLNIDFDMQREYKGSIKQVPVQILELPKLEKLSLNDQPIEIPPQEVVKKGIKAIKNYWRQQQEVGIDYLCEAKLIIVGEAGAGKTSLAKKIEYPDYPLKPQEDSTEGIDVIRWSFPASIRIHRDCKEEFHQTDFKVNIWDFGGQEIYHATHQFFLTRRSLYALVADDRKEDTDFNYWLQVVELLSNQSPLILVQNEKQERQRDIDLGRLRADFANLREAFRINLATNRGLDELIKAIRQELEYLPHIGTPLPRTWSRVRAALENDSRNYICLDEYLNICEDNGFTRREDKLQLSVYLHDLGICLHFQDDPILKNTVILKPKWGTDAVYRVLDDHTILDNRGRFAPKDLARIWSEEKYAPMRDELLRLMMKFQLCYQLPHQNAYIAPQLLSPTRPDYQWVSPGGLILRYDYDFMPKGILTRFIVAVNHLIADQNLVWKSGVILSREGSRAEVIEDYPRRKITVRVNGPDSRGLLAIVDDHLEQIHASFPRLKYDKFLPCNCSVCRERPDPFAYPLKDLKDFAAKQDHIQCRNSRKLVDAAALIKDALPSAIYSPYWFSYGVEESQPVSCATTEPIRKEVFVSYAWSNSSTAIVDKLHEALKNQDISLIRDKNEVKYKDSIRDFMQGIGHGKCIIVVLSKKYLESKNCMFEMTEIADNQDIRDRVFPIILEDAGIYDASERLDYIQYWEQKKSELDAKMKRVGGENLKGIREELDLFAKIRNTIAEIVDTLADMNALTPDQHRGTNFEALLRALEKRLEE